MKKKKIQEARFDYYNMDQEEEDDSDFGEDELSHILEIYDFPVDFKTEDLLKSFQSYQYVQYLLIFSIGLWNMYLKSMFALENCNFLKL